MNIIRTLSSTVLLLAVAACQHVDAGKPQLDLAGKTIVRTETCEASVYKDGARLATGERYNPHEVLIAHRTAPLYSWVRVTNLRNSRQIITRVRDRGPFAQKHKRCVDLSLGASHELKFPWGVGQVRVEHLK